MKTRLGAILAIVLGALLVTVGATAPGSSVGVSVTICGGFTPIGTVVPSCPTGHINITKVVNGPAADAPAAGWDFTIASTDCTIYPGTSTHVHIAAAGGTQASGQLYETQFLNSTDFCHYTVTETAVAGWTTTYSQMPPLTLPNTGLRDNDVALTVTNTHPTVTSSAPRSSTSSAPHTTATTPASQSASATTALANTGTRNALPEIVAGSLLIAVGGLLLLFGRRPRGMQH